MKTKASAAITYTIVTMLAYAGVQKAIDAYTNPSPYGIANNASIPHYGKNPTTEERTAALRVGSLIQQCTTPLHLTPTQSIQEASQWSKDNYKPEWDTLLSQVQNELKISRWIFTPYDHEILLNGTTDIDLSKTIKDTDHWHHSLNAYKLAAFFRAYAHHQVNNNQPDKAFDTLLDAFEITKRLSQRNTLTDFITNLVVSMKIADSWMAIAETSAHPPTQNQLDKLATYKPTKASLKLALGNEMHINSNIQSKIIVPITSSNHNTSDRLQSLISSLFRVAIETPNQNLAQIESYLKDQLEQPVTSKEFNKIRNHMLLRGSLYSSTLMPGTIPDISNVLSIIEASNGKFDSIIVAKKDTITSPAQVASIQK